MLVEILRWAAAAGVVVAALMTASNISRRVTGWGFVLFAVTAAMWVAAGLMNGENALVFQNAILFAINLVGVYRWLWLRSGEGRSASRALPDGAGRTVIARATPPRAGQPARA